MKRQIRHAFGAFIPGYGGYLSYMGVDEAARGLDAFLTGEPKEHVMGEAARDFLEPQRIAITGRLVSTGTYESLTLLGRDEAFARYRATLGQLAELWANA